jgi:hypothetical protein
MTTNDTIPAAHHAIARLKDGKMPPNEFLALVVAGKVFVPLAGAPQMENGEIKRWRPAMAGKPDKSQWLIAFTSPKHATDYVETHAVHNFKLEIEMKWVLKALPPDYGIVFNMRTPDVFEWKAADVANYKKTVLGK